MFDFNPDEYWSQAVLIPSLELDAAALGEPEVQEDLLVHFYQGGLEHQRHSSPIITRQLFSSIL